MDDLKQFVRALLSHWIALMSGGAIIVALGIVERASGKNIPWAVYITLICALIVISSFLAWRDKQKELVDARQSIDELMKGLAAERDPIGREFEAIRLRLLTSSLAPVIARELGNLKALILSRRELLTRKDVGDFFVKWIKPYEIHLQYGAQLDLTQAQYEEMMRDLAGIGDNPDEKTLTE